MPCGSPVLGGEHGRERDEKTIVLTNLTGAAFEKVYQLNVYPGHFELWSSLDFSQYESPNFTAVALQPLEFCYRHGSKDIGEHTRVHNRIHKVLEDANIKLDAE